MSCEPLPQITQPNLDIFTVSLRLHSQKEKKTNFSENKDFTLAATVHFYFDRYLNYGVKHKVDVTIAGLNTLTERVNLRNSFVDHVGVVRHSEVQIYDFQNTSDCNLL